MILTVLRMCLGKSMPRQVLDAHKALSISCGGYAEYDLMASWDAKCGACANSSFWRAKITAIRKRLLVLIEKGVKGTSRFLCQKMSANPKEAGISNHCTHLLLYDSCCLVNGQASLPIISF